LFVLGCAELAFRTIIFPEYKAMMPDRFVQRSGFVYSNKPNSETRRYNPMNYDVMVRTNSMGFRGLEENLKDGLAGYWIAGGSNAFGAYIEDNEVFSARLQQQGYPTANVAVDGHEVADQILILRDLIERGYRPRGVLLTLTALNSLRDYTARMAVMTQKLGGDFQENTAPAPRPRERLMAAALSLWQQIPRSFQSVRGRLIKSSALYGWLKVGIMGIPALRAMTLRWGLRADLDLVHSGSLDIFRPLSPQNPDWPRILSTTELISQLADLVHEKFGVPFGVVLLPTHHQIYPEKFQRYVNQNGLQNEDLDPLRPLLAMETELKRRGVPVLNTLPVLKRSATARLTFPDDGHLIPEGHAIVASAVIDWLDGGMQ
jgi:hypothetical protein